VVEENKYNGDSSEPIEFRDAGRGDSLGHVFSARNISAGYRLVKAGGPGFVTVLNFRVADPSWVSRVGVLFFSLVFADSNSK
jgi:hypothetical protein